ncbi:MAG: 2OG-Fe(II) oxygenase [Proteobacteria bacterium]|nr:2OG-Fe(II) oxygenase [Pseudomonadota bacterium]
MSALAPALDAQGWAPTGLLLTPEECAELVALYDRPDGFRSTVVMARHGFGQGEYRYFSDPLPALVQRLRETLYPPLAEVANRHAAALGLESRWPETHAELRQICAAAGQTRPTPLLLRYGPGDYNRLHQDLYGEVVFPFQVAILRNQPGRDFEGGEFVLVENRPRMQAQAQVVPLGLGEGVAFAVRERPVRGSRGYYRAQMRHGVSALRSGRRHTLGIIFHDAA